MKTLYEYCMEQSDSTLLEQWDRERNGELTPHRVSHGSHKQIWWRCEREHRWQAAVYTRTGAGAGCPVCKGRRLEAAENSLAVRFPELAKQWHPEKNGSLTPEMVMPTTHRKVWWQCGRGHSWQAQVNARTRGTGCPVCGNRKVAAGENDLATVLPAVAAQWDRERNGTLSPEAVLPGSSVKVWWRCEKGHRWQASVKSRCSNGAGCPVCTGKQVLPGENDLASQFPELAAQWDSTRNGALLPQQVTAFSNRKVWWVCGLGHAYAAVISSRTMAAAGCPYCAGKKVLPGFNDLQTRYPAIAAQWEPELNGSLTPEMVTPGSKRKVWWQCSDGHVWKTVVYSRTGPKKTGCPVCAGRVKESNMSKHGKPYLKK